ncbi:hypothetical protein PT2222_440003 [Paraburkholderia tropica]
MRVEAYIGCCAGRAFTPNGRTMPFSSQASTHSIDLYTLVDSVLPAQWIGFLALGSVALATAIVIAYVLLVEVRDTC